MLIDACAVIAIISGEPDSAIYHDALEQAPSPFITALSAWEAILVLARPEQLNCTFSQAQRLVIRWLDANGVELRAPGDPREILNHAVVVAEKHGAGKRALSNFDCFHYAHAKASGAPLLTLDRILRQTDVETRP